MLTNIISVAYGDDPAPTARTYSYRTSEPVEVGDLVLVTVGTSTTPKTATVREVNIDPASLSFAPEKLKAFVGKVVAETGEITQIAMTEELGEVAEPEQERGLATVLPEYTPDIDVIIRLKQLPEIEEQLATMKAAVEQRTSAVLALTCTEDNLAEIKKIRTAFRAEFDQFEQRRKAIKTQILAPYERFNAVYEDCIGGAYKKADADIKAKITAVEDNLKDAKIQQARAWYNEYALSVGVQDFADFDKHMNGRGRTNTPAELRRICKEKLDLLASGVAAIEAQPEDVRAEIYAEFKQSLNAADAIATVSRRRAQIAEQARLRAERERAEQAQAQAVAKVEAALPPIPETPPTPEVIAPPEPPHETVQQDAPPIMQTADERIITAAFKVRGTLTKLKALKQFLEENNYDYE
jgi:hypothetical protein